MNRLKEIVDHKRVEVSASEADMPLELIKAEALKAPVPKLLSTAICASAMGLIAEVKRRSPSVGLIRDPFDPPAIAQGYERGGAQGVSVLMDNKYFGGGAADYRAVREAIALPMLFKEFVVSEWQVWQARALGANAVLLIVAGLSRSELDFLIQKCADAEIEYLLEVHDEEEMAVACSVGAPFVGVNNRNLKTFETDIESSFRLKDRAPDDATLISESGIRNAEDVLALQAGGLHGVLVGEHLLKCPNVQEAVDMMMGAAWER